MNLAFALHYYPARRWLLFWMILNMNTQFIIISNMFFLSNYHHNGRRHHHPHRHLRQKIFARPPQPLVQTG